MLMCCQVLKCDSVLRWSALIGMFVALLVVGCGPMDESDPGRNVNSSQDNATETPTPDAATADTSSSDDSSTPPTVGTDSQPPESTPETTASTTPQVPSNEAPETESTAPVSSPESEPTTVASNPPASTNEGNEPSGEPTEPGEEPAAPSDDPVAPGEEIVEYEGWGEPAVVFFVTGRQNGYIEPCGCTGLANQKGGLLRRDTMLAQLRARGWEVIPIDLGNQEHRFGAQASIKFTKTVEALGGLMGYQAVGIGPDDLRLPSTDLVQAIENSGANQNIFVSANVGLFGDYLPKVQVLERQGHKIGVTSVLGPKAMAQVNNADVELSTPAEALPIAAALMDEAGCELKVLMIYGTVEETDAIVAAHGEFDLVVCSGVDGEPTIAPALVESNGRSIPVVQTGIKGMYVGVVGWFPGEETTIRYQRVPLDARFEDSERMKRLFIEYQDQLETMGLDGLDLRPVSHPSGHTFVGSQVCGDCHSTAFEIWEEGVDGQGGPHAHATRSLVEPNERTWVKRHFDPECLSCHTTGWNPQQYFPYEGGYVDLEKSQALFGNGCENCHGPGSAHVAAEMGDVVATNDEMTTLRNQMRVKLDAT
ncbi:MAG: hypothetical protein KDA83_21525, partial [Planctomycetales bacterium]|nr:hypothetical protein [Planctomycetales bacterium]